MNKKHIVLQADHLTKSFQQGDSRLTILDAFNLTVHEGEFVGLMGPSGSGKSTLLNILGLLEMPSHGTLAIANDIVDFHNDAYLTKLRLQFIGFVFQFHHLLPEFTAQENVALPLIIRGQSPQEAMIQAEQTLGRVQLAHRLQHRPAQLSGGEQQRVALARAVITRPQLILADEPTGNLDPETGNHIFELLLSLCEEQKTAVIMATHNPSFIDQMDYVVTLGRTPSS